MERNTQPQIDSQEVIVTKAQEKYIEAKEKTINAKKDLDELDYDCMLKAFEENHDRITTLGKDLDKYGITIKYDEPIAVNPTVASPENYDCRYKPQKECQMPYLNTMTDEQRMGCR